MKKANLTVSVYWTRHENDVGHGPPSFKKALPAPGTVSDYEIKDGKITQRPSQYHMCFGSDQFVERAHRKTESVEIKALKPILACTPLGKPLPERMRAKPVRDARTELSVREKAKCNSSKSPSSRALREKQQLKDKITF